MKLLQKVTKRYVFSKVTTFETLSVMPQSQNSIGDWPFLTVQEIFRKFKKVLSDFDPAP